MSYIKFEEALTKGRAIAYDVYHDSSQYAIWQRFGHFLLCIFRFNQYWRLMFASGHTCGTIVNGLDLRGKKNI